MSTPSQLDAASKCYCFNDAEFKRVVAYLLDQINSGGGGGTVQDMQVAWTPTNVKLGQEIGFSSDPAGNGNPTLAGITSLTFSQSTSAAGFDIQWNSSITSISFPNLTSVDSTNSQGGYFAAGHLSALTSISIPLLQTVAGVVLMNANTSLTSLSAPALSSMGGNLSIGGNTSMSSLSLPSLVSVGDTLNLFGDSALTNLSLPSLTTITGVSTVAIQATNCTTLSTVSFNNYLPTNGTSILFPGCALSAASVNHILARGVASAGYVSGSIDLSGGTSAAPSGQGVADKATLIGRGVTVATN